MAGFKGQYHGAALLSFIVGLGHSQQLTNQILQQHKLQQIDPDEWYDLNLARALYIDISTRVGERSLHSVGQKMIETADFPPSVNDLKSLLGCLGDAYRLNARGEQIGDITCEFIDEDTALVVASTPFPCALERGIIQGCCKTQGVSALIEHGDDGCRDKGHTSCTYRITW
jgi:hypothetical protein